MAVNTKKAIPLAGAILASLVVTVWYRHDPAACTAVLAAALRQSTPLALGALCGICGERCGVMNIGIEGQMLLAAFVAYVVAAGPGGQGLAATAAVATGAAMGLILAVMAVTLKMDQIIAGTVLNVLALGLSGYFYQPGLTIGAKLQAFSLGPLKDLPLVGALVFACPPITLATPVLVLTLYAYLFHTPWGLRARAAGEHPQAAATLGIGVAATRYGHVIVGGTLAGLAGAFLTLEAVGTFERVMTNGRGFVALAVMIFGRWHPLGAWAAALLFGLAAAAQTQFQFAGTLAIPPQFVGMLPYLLTIFALALVGGKARPPAALGQP